MDELKLYEQFQDLSLSFPKLRLQRYGKGHWYVRGMLRFSEEHFRRCIEDEYSIEIAIPEEYPDVLPKIVETGNRIPGDFHHYQDGSLCLGAPLDVKQKFRKQPTLLGYVDNCVIPYLYSYSYKCKFGKMPFGELSHGGIGLLEYYRELFGIKDQRRVLKLIQILTEEQHYRDHDRCPCGSGKRLRSCHGTMLLEIQKLQSPTEFLNEYHWIVRDLANKAFSNPYRPFFY